MPDQGWGNFLRRYAEDMNRSAYHARDYAPEFTDEQSERWLRLISGQDEEQYIGFGHEDPDYVESPAWPSIRGECDISSISVRRAHEHGCSSRKGSGGADEVAGALSA
jgi:hypothetical protein